ncbi:hypothetical protein K443DRAFT_11471 [Laccaria amethystina LaAM-08-1]|uniref:Uncharacterized protein n=1 Tax=Laccaria amethystina LaAM-08-1 TaxID=1095629 RepID=A0A0C9WJV1_9AGAR|nr:hypothetical protein K443DRAFT_11471 [Laccaria amethystina LaAM-08-1]
MSTLSRSILRPKYVDGSAQRPWNMNRTYLASNIAFPHLHLFFNSIPASTSRLPTPAFKRESCYGDAFGDSPSLPGIHPNVTTGEEAPLRYLPIPLGLTTILVDRQGVTPFLLLEGRRVAAGNLPSESNTENESE